MQRSLFSLKFIVPTLILAGIYLISAVYLMNAELAVSTLFGNFTLSYKISLMSALLGGMWTAITRVELVILIITSILTGANLTLIVQRISSLYFSKKLQLVVGGGSLLGIVGSGCAACGLPILSLLGLTGSLIYLPFGGNEIAFIALGLLGISFYTLTKSQQRQQRQDICLLNSNLSKI